MPPSAVRPGTGEPFELMDDGMDEQGMEGRSRWVEFGLFLTDDRARGRKIHGLKCPSLSFYDGSALTLVCGILDDRLIPSIHLSRCSFGGRGYYTHLLVCLFQLLFPRISPPAAHVRMRMCHYTSFMETITCYISSLAPLELSSFLTRSS